MVIAEVRFDGDAVRVRRFGDLRHGFVVRRGETDRLTGWSYEELRALGEGVWEFPEPTPATAPAYSS